MINSKNMSGENRLSCCDTSSAQLYFMQPHPWRPYEYLTVFKQLIAKEFLGQRLCLPPVHRVGARVKSPFFLGDWLVSPSTNAISKGELVRRMEPRLMDVLCALAARGQDVVSADDLLDACWGGAPHGDSPVHKTIAQLRRLLDDSATAPRYIATIRKRGYQLVAALLPVDLAAPAGAIEAPSWQGSPFLGLSAFDEQHAALFFGRAAATAALLQAVQARLQQGPALQLILGPSGSGKSSLVCAGLLPALLRDGGSRPPVLCAARLDLRDSCAASLMTTIGAALLDWEVEGQALFPDASAASLGEKLASDPHALAAQLLARLSAQAAPGARAPMAALFIDSLEALFTLPDIDDEQRRSMVDMLDVLSCSGAVLVLLACRNDFYPSLAAYPFLLSCKQQGGHFDLQRPNRAEMAQMIALPARAAGLRFAQDPDTLERLDQRLARSVADNPDALPLLQYTLQELYRLRSDDGELTLAALRQLGGIEGAIGHRAEQVIQALGESERAALPRLLSLVVALSADDEQISSRRSAWSALRTDAERALVQALVEARLFVSELVDQQPGFAVAHEAVLRRWPRVLDWIAAHRQALRLRAHLARQALRWDSEGRSADLLLPTGRQLNDARGLLQEGLFVLSEAELALVRVSQRRATRGARLRMGALSLMLGLALLATVAGLLAMRANTLAQQRRAEVEGLLSFMLGDFADKLRPLARLDLLDAVSARAMGYLSEASADAASPASLTQQAQALQVIAEVRIARGDSAAAETALLTARAILERQRAATPDDPALWKKHGANSFWLGKIKMERNDWDGAQTLFENYREDSERLFMAQPDNVDGWIELSYAHNTLGTLALKRGDVTGAAERFTRSVALKTAALKRKPGERTLAAELADSLSWVASAEESLGRLDAAFTLYQRELDIVQRVRDEAQGEALWQNRVAIALQHLAQVRLLRGDASGALKDWQVAESLLNQLLLIEPGNRVWQRNRAMVQLEQLRVQALRQAPAQVLARLRVVGADIDELVRLEPKKAEWTRLRAVARQRTAVQLLKLGQDADAASMLEAARTDLTGLLAANKADLRSRDALVQTLLTVAELHRARRQPEAAQASCRAALAMLPPLTPESRDFKVLDPWIRIQHCVENSNSARLATTLLQGIGYSEPAFQTFMTHYK